MSWATVLTQWTPAGLYARSSAEGVGFLLGTENSTARDMLVQTAGINLMGTFYQSKLQERFINEFPDDLENVLLQYTRDVQRMAEFQNYKNSVAGVNDAIDQVTMASGLSLQAFPPGTSLVVPSGGIFGVTTQARPALYLFDSSQQPVDSTLLAGQTQPGDRAGDLYGNVVYINQGTTATPVWNRADSSNLTDWILNPDRLLEPGYLRIMKNLRAYAADVPKGEQIEWNYTVLAPAIKTQLAEITDYEKTAFALIQIDYARNGIVSDPSRRANRNRQRVF